MRPKCGAKTRVKAPTCKVHVNQMEGLLKNYTKLAMKKGIDGRMLHWYGYAKTTFCLLERPAHRKAEE
jgi:hypothetical protein